MDVDKIDIGAELGTVLNFLRTKLQEIDPDHVWFEYHNSINSKRWAVHLLGEEVINQIPQFMREQEKVATEGYSTIEQSTILLIKYQAFLNIVYAICENLAFLGKQFVPDLPNSYNKQISQKKFAYLKEQYPLYARVLEKNVWYKHMHAMRSEATHFFDGLICISSSDRPGILFQKMINRRDGVKPDTRIDIPDIEVHVNELVNGVDNYIKNLCDYLRTFITEDCELYEMCFLKIEGEKGVRVFGPKVKSYLEFRDGAPWRCKTQFPCILEKSCPFVTSAISPSAMPDDVSTPEHQH